jgi:hypothetical protein
MKPGRMAIFSFLLLVLPVSWVQADDPLASSRAFVQKFYA